MRGKIKNLFNDNIDILFEIGLILIATALFLVFDKKFSFGVWYSIILIVLILIILVFAVKYLRENKK
ncbi:hypothetical protein HYT25_03515 [Candidatus Pacearchaeota archaeon]|nr:hypothetical protein [Candidatus Pacearchaeota archaeon]